MEDTPLDSNKLEDRCAVDPSFLAGKSIKYTYVSSHNWVRNYIIFVQLGYRIFLVGFPATRYLPKKLCSKGNIKGITDRKKWDNHNGQLVQVSPELTAVWIKVIQATPLTVTVMGYCLPHFRCDGPCATHRYLWGRC